MDVVTHGARTEEDKAQALESGSRLRSSARLGYLNSSSSASLSSSSAAAAAGTGGTAGNTTNTTTTTTTATTTATTTCRTSSKRKRKRRRRQQRTNNTNDNDNNENNDIDEVDGLQTVLESSSSSTSRTHTNSSILIEDNLLSSPSGNNANTGGSGGGGTSATTAGSSSIGRRNDEGTSRHRHNHNNNNNNNNNSNYSSNHHRQQQRIEDYNDNTATGGGGGSGTRGEVEEEYNNNNRHHEEEEEDEELVGGERSNERNHRNTGNSSSPTTTTNITTTTTTLRNGGNNSNTRAAASSTAAATASTAAASAAASSSSSVPSLADITFLNRRTAKRSARRCNNTSGRRNAMTMDLQRLINEVHARPAIWDQKNVNYHNRDVILKMWREIARACEVSTDVAKSKWKHLRDNFRNELKKTYRGKCDGSLSGGNEHDSKWVWFRSLFFLREQMNSRVIGCALNQNCTALRSSPDGTQIEPQIDILEGHEETQFDDLDGDSCQSLLSNDDGLHHVMPPPKMNKIGRKRILMEAMDNDYSEMDRKRYEVLQKRLILNQEEEDDTYHFLMSVKNPLKSLPLDRQMFVRLKIQEIVYNEINSQNHQIRSYDNSQDVKPLKSQNDNGNESTGNNGNNGDVVSDMSNPASLLQNCATEGSSDDAFFG
ncbi:PREDICTED: putative uncharacterized protein DDB_G0282133 [Polistes dominula]|uniref:MADF domain-containing protein n=1 Tax=Polistes dominula TaxID=743375 RepID=A0ABM1IG96_POLDO|nr:PREDICTED: putative uncharacterized protein DDB_G0282133 [Polistes dominula]